MCAVAQHALPLWAVPGACATRSGMRARRAPASCLLRAKARQWTVWEFPRSAATPTPPFHPSLPPCQALTPRAARRRRCRQDDAATDMAAAMALDAHLDDTDGILDFIKVRAALRTPNKVSAIIYLRII